MNLSIVVPVYNEEDNLPLLYQAIKNAMSGVENAWEVVLVDDGSWDGTGDLLDAWATDAMIANFFRVTCPYLFTLDTVAYFALQRGAQVH